MNISTQKKITIDYIKEQLKILSPETVLLSTEYIDNRHKLDFICSCGKNFQKIGLRYNKGRNVCVILAQEKMGGARLGVKKITANIVLNLSWYEVLHP